eukprot:COSAG06_NODE_19162_length_851_cov_0.667553_1_plen_185_part_10
MASDDEKPVVSEADADGLLAVEHHARQPTDSAVLSPPVQRASAASMAKLITMPAAPEPLHDDPLNFDGRATVDEGAQGEITAAASIGELELESHLEAELELELDSESQLEAELERELESEPELESQPEPEPGPEPEPEPRRTMAKAQPKPGRDRRRSIQPPDLSQYGSPRARGKAMRDELDEALM